MSHNIEIKNGRASFAYAGETPWHRLGQKLKEAFDAKTAIKAAGLNFTVEKAAIQVADSKVIIPNRFAIRRTDTKDILGVVGKSYEPLQNSEAFAFFDGVFGKNKARYECAGVLGKGERIWLLAKLPGNFAVQGDDVIGKYLLLTNGHDGSEAVRARFTPIRVVCQNTLNAALRERSKEIYVMHHSNIKERLEIAGKLLKEAGIYFDEAQKTFKAFAGFKLSEQNRLAYFTQVVAETNKPLTELSSVTRQKIEKLQELHETGKGTDLPKTRGTLWGAFNAVTEFVDHVQTENSITYMATGAGAQIKTRAFAHAKELVLTGN
jgi:phage/plasmid-like protein (TIGR03299 family)